jgi:hypothetical protein
MTDELPKPETIKAVRFLTEWPGYPTLTAIHTDPVTGEKGLIETKAFPPDPTTGTWDTNAVRLWIDARQGKANLYFLVNPTREPKNNKASRTDLSALMALHVDVDVRVGEDQAAGIERIIKTFNDYRTPPSFITSSGGGAQAFWMLDKALEIDGTKEMADDAALYNMALERDLAGDHCHNIDRIMRLPGTINIPNTLKLKKGRKPALAMIVSSHPELNYSIDKFSKVPADKPKEEKVGDPAAPGAVPKTAKSKTEDTIVYEGVAVISDDTPIITITDQRLTAVDLTVKQIIILGKPPEDAPDNVKQMSRGQIDMKVVSELVRCGLTDKGIKQVYRLGKIAGDAAEWPRGFDGDMDRLILAARELARDPEIEAFNREFCAIDLAGKMRIMTWRASILYPGQYEPVFSTFDDFRLKHRNRKKAVLVKIKDEDGNDTGETKSKKVSLVDYWLRHPQMRQYNNGMAFIPRSDELAVGGDAHHLTLNLWKGFSVPPQAGDWSLLKEHILKNLCCGNEAYCDYLIKWMAFIVQFKKPTEVAVVLRGDNEGTGKTFFSKHFGKLFGRHAMLISNPAHILGQFNPHLETSLVIGAEEAIFSGDKRQRDAFWSLITGATITIEPKGYPIYTVPSYLNFILTTNHKLAVPVSASARRIFELEVGTAQRQNKPYFDKIEAQLKAGGYAGMLHDLLHMDLSEFDVTNCPKTEYLKASQALSVNGVDALVMKACSEARVPCVHWKWPAYSYSSALNGNNDGFDNLIDHSGDKELSGLRSLKVKHILCKEWDCVSGDRAQKRVGEHRIAGIIWPKLIELRAKFEKVHGKQEWLVPDATEWIGGNAPGSTPDSTADDGQDRFIDRATGKTML